MLKGVSSSTLPLQTVLTSYATVADAVVWHKVHHLAQLDSFSWNRGIELVQPEKPCDLEQLLWEEESAYEIWLKTKE
jgi:hypothetical protein